MAEEYDVTQPILILVRRGRGGRGYLIAAADDASNPLPCPDEAEIGKAVLELLNDPAQPRFDEKQFEEDLQRAQEEEDEDFEEEYEDEDEGEGEDDGDDDEVDDKKPTEPDPLDELGLDPAEKLLFKFGEAILGKARSASNDYRDKRKKRKKKSKKKRARRR